VNKTMARRDDPKSRRLLEQAKADEAGESS
jgi:hypothetical protein